MIMVISDANGTPLNTEVESASTYEGHVAEKTVDGIRVKKHTGRKTRTRRLVPKRVISDKGYDDDGLRKRFAKRRIDFIVPYRGNRANQCMVEKLPPCCSTMGS